MVKAHHGSRAKQPSRPASTSHSQSRSLMVPAPSPDNKKGTLTESPLAVIASLRSAMLSQVSEEDVRAMMQAQVDKAKAGDQAAARFVFEFVLGGKNGPQQQQPKKAIQNNYYMGDAVVKKDEDGAERPMPAVSTPARPGTNKKVEAMRARVERGVGAFHEEDEDLRDDED